MLAKCFLLKKYVAFGNLLDIIGRLPKGVPMAGEKKHVFTIFGKSTLADLAAIPIYTPNYPVSSPIIHNKLKGTQVQSVTFDEFKKVYEEDMLGMAKKKTTSGQRWMPVKKNGKLVADGIIVRNNDSGIPDPIELGMTYTKSEFEGDKPTVESVVGIVQAAILSNAFGDNLEQVQKVYKTILESAKGTGMSPSTFYYAIKPLGNTAKKIVPSYIVMKLEEETVSKYSKYLNLKQKVKLSPWSGEVMK